jgi:hypothetical protein
MKGSSRTHPKKKAQKPEAVRATPAQIVRQVGLILIVTVLWAGSLVVYLHLTSPDKTPVSETPQATAVAAVLGTTPSAAPTDTPPPSEAGSISFSKDVLPILTNRCQNCHGGGRAEAGLNLTSYEGVMAGALNRPVVVPNSSATSSLVESIVTGQMPRRAPKLPASEIETISNWVDQGALDN